MVPAKRSRPEGPEDTASVKKAKTSPVDDDDIVIIDGGAGGGAIVIDDD